MGAPGAVWPAWEDRVLDLERGPQTSQAGLEPDTSDIDVGGDDQGVGVLHVVPQDEPVPQQGSRRIRQVVDSGKDRFLTCGRDGWLGGHHLDPMTTPFCDGGIIFPRQPP